MANEFKHKDPGTALTQAEFIASDGTGHIFDGQAAGDILYASSTTVLKNLAKATDGNVLELASGLPAWTASPTIGSTSWANANHAHAASNSGGTLTTLGTVTTGVWQGTVVAAAYLPDASPTAQGVVELAIASEVTTGTSTALAVSPDGLAGSVVFGTRYVQMVVVDFTADIAEGNGKFYLHIPAGLNGMDLVEVHAKVITVGSGSTVDIMIHNLTDTTDMLSTSLTIDDGELDSKDAGTAAVINSGEDDVVTNDVLRIDVDGNGGDTTVAKGLIVTLGFRIPD
jgi:hypothetical protein